MDAVPRLGALQVGSANQQTLGSFWGRVWAKGPGCRRVGFVLGSSCCEEIAMPV